MDAKHGRVDRPESDAFTGNFACHQKARVMYEVCRIRSSQESYLLMSPLSDRRSQPMQEAD